MTVPRITRVDSDGHGLVWHCSTCDKPIHNGAGWIELVGEQMRCAHDRRRREDEIEARHRATGITSAGDYIDLPGPARWRATCRVCNGDDAGSGYFIGVDRIATVAELLPGAFTPDDLRKRFEAFLNDRCKGKDASKLRFVVE